MKKTLTLLSTLLFFNQSFAQNNNVEISFDRTIQKSNGNNKILRIKRNDNKIEKFIGFEEEEGYTLGNIYNQKNWITASHSIVGLPKNHIITDTLAYSGNSSLLIGYDERFSTELNSYPIGAYHQLPSVQNNEIEVYVQLSIDQKHMYRITTQDTNMNLYKDLITFYRNNIYIVDFEERRHFQLDSSIFPNTWHKINIIYNKAKRTIEYKLDDQTIYTRNSVSDDNFGYNQINFMSSNGSKDAKLYIDNLTYKEKSSLSTSNINNKTSISIYPNPTTDFVFIQKATDETIESITVGDFTGKTLKQINPKENKIDLTSLTNGSYILKIKTNKELFVQKILKK